jgi:hypothetical protein
MYLYHVLFILINIYGVDCQKKNWLHAVLIGWSLLPRARISESVVEPNLLRLRSHVHADSSMSLFLLRTYVCPVRRRVGPFPPRGSCALHTRFLQLMLALRWGKARWQACHIGDATSAYTRPLRHGSCNFRCCLAVKRAVRSRAGLALSTRLVGRVGTGHVNVGLPTDVSIHAISSPVAASIESVVRWWNHAVMHDART